MSLSSTQATRTITDLKRKTKEVLSQVRRTKRPVVLTVNGKADAVLMDARTYEKYLKASHLARLLARAENDIAAGRTRPIRSFLREFKRARKVPR
jgi:prevent-host-death family protein